VNIPCHTGISYIHIGCRLRTYMLMLSFVALPLSACSKPEDKQGALQPQAKIKYVPPVPGLFPPEMEPYRGRIEESKLEFVRIKASKDFGTEPLASKFLGRPYWPKDVDYPCDVHGKPLVLLAQLNFTDIPSLIDYPAGGILQFFISGEESREHVWGMAQYDEKPFSESRYFESMQAQRFFRVVYHSRVPDDPKQVSAAPLVKPSWPLPIGHEAKLRFESSAEPVLTTDYRFDAVFGKPAYEFFQQFGDKASAVYAQYGAYAYKYSLGKIGGYTLPVQSDPRSLRPGEDWVLLLEIQSADDKDGVDILWGDAGMGAFYIRRDDLKKLDFSKVVYYWDNH